MRRPALLILLLLLAPVCQAIDFRSQERLDIPAGGATTNELWAQARTITFAGTAIDDCFLLADLVTQPSTNAIPTLLLSGTFRSSVWAAGDTVHMTGAATRHARLAALKTCTIDGDAGGNLMAFAPAIVIGPVAVIRGGVLLIGQDIIVDGKIEGDARIMGTKVTLAGQFSGNLDITADDITVLPGTAIAGNLVYRMDGDLVLDSRTTLGGKMIKREILQPPAESFTASSLMLQLGLFAGALLVGMLFVSLMPGIVALSVHKLSESAWRCVLFGFVAFSLVPMTAFFLLFTLVGIPLSIMLMLAYCILMYAAKIVTALFLGHLLLKRKGPLSPRLLFPVMALGLLILYAASNLPFPFGIVAWFTITLAGMGALAGAILDRRIPVMVATPQDPAAKPPDMPGAVPPGAV